MRLYGLLLSCLAPIVYAIFADEANQVDFHLSLLGQPRPEQTFFHSPSSPGTSKGSLLYTLSDKNVLGAVNPRDGSIRWRQVLSSNKTADKALLATGDAQDTIFSSSESSVRAWDAVSGRLTWDKKYDGSSIKGLGVVSSPDTTTVTNDVVVATDGPETSVLRLDGSSGAVKWKFVDSSNDRPYRIVTSKDQVYLISFPSTLLKGNKIKVTSLDPENGSQKVQYTLSVDGDISSEDDVCFVDKVGGTSLIAWKDSSRKTLKINVLGGKDIRSLDVDAKGKEVTDITLHADAKDSGTPQFLVHIQAADNHWAQVYTIDRKKSTITKDFDLQNLAGRAAFPATMVESKLYFLRVTEAESTLISSASDTVLAKWNLKGLNATYIKDKPSPIHAASEVVVRSSSSYAVRSAVLLSTGDWILVRNEEIVWTRPEFLSQIVKAQYAESVGGESFAEQSSAEVSSNPISAFVHRVVRHFSDIEKLAVWLQGFPKVIMRMLTDDASLGQAASFVADSVGFNQIVVVATANRRFAALEVGNRGRILWSIDGTLTRSTEPCLTDIDWTSTSSISRAITCLSKRPRITQSQQESVNLSPSGNEKHSSAYRNQSNLRSAVYTEPHGSKQIKFVLKDGHLEAQQTGGQSIWHFTTAPSERIVSVGSKPSNERVASIGKVLGDRRVLYKHLNENAILVVTANNLKKFIKVNLLDGVSGNILYTSQQGSVDTSRPIASVISENWFAISYTIDSAIESVSKGYQIVMFEMYQSVIPNDRGSFGSMSNYSSTTGGSPVGYPHIISQSYHIPEEIEQMAVTQTTQGITSRQILAVLASSNAIVTIPRQALDPRRPVGKDPTTNQLEEGLSRYSPMIDFDAKWYLTHKEEVLGIENILTTPALLESTSLIFAYGHDVFGTRMAPSFSFDILGKNFNKVQLILTVLALTVGVFIVGPMIQRKQTNTLWQAV